MTLSFLVVWVSVINFLLPQRVLYYWTISMFRIVSITIFFGLTSGGQSPPLRTCESTVGHVVNATVTGCEFKNRKYIFKNGVKAGIEVYFETDKEIQNFKVIAIGKLSQIVMPYPLPNSDGCSNLKCPLQKGGPYFFQYTLALPKFFHLPKIELKVIFKLQDQSNDIIACVIIPVKIK